jgi:hypothetical protein
MCAACNFHTVKMVLFSTFVKYAILTRGLWGIT